MRPVNRRTFVRTAGSAVASLPFLGLSGCSRPPSRARVVVVGGGFAGGAAARYLRLWDPSIEVTVVERRNTFVSCPMSNLVLAGHRQIEELEHEYVGLAALGVEMVHDDATAVYPTQKMVRLASGRDLFYDRLIVAPGIDFAFDDTVGCEAAIESGQIFHAWRPGDQTIGLRRQIEAMPDGGVYVITIPPVPFRCPPGPYERVTLVADYFARTKPSSHILVFDSNPDIVSKGALFRQAWAERTPGMIEYIPNTRPDRVDGATNSIAIDGEMVRGDVLNVIPTQRAGELATRAGLVMVGERWCRVDWRTCESVVVPDVHVLGDATDSAPGMPKSGHMANAQAKVCAAAVVELLNGRSPNPDPIFTNTCYSYVSGTEAMHVASVHRWDAERTTVSPVVGAGGLSAAPNPEEGIHAWSWAQNIWADTVGGSGAMT